MRLTRRDAVLALETTAATGSLGLTVAKRERQVLETADQSVTTRTIRCLIVIAEAVYPSQVSVTQECLKAYISRLPEERQEVTVAAVDAVAQNVRRTRNESLISAPDVIVDATLQRMGVDQVDADPGGTVAERVRFYVVISRLYFLFTTPKGGRFVGIDNPVGYPRGIHSYQDEP